MDNYTDGQLTDALLAAGTVNVEEYGQSQQVLLSDTLRVNRDDGMTQGLDVQESVQNAYNVSGSVLKQYLTSQAGYIKWTYPEYVPSFDLENIKPASGDGEEIWRFYSAYGFDHDTKEYDDSHKNEICYLTFENNAEGGEVTTSWISSTDLDNAFLDFVKTLSSDTSQLGNQLADAHNKELSKTFDNFLYTFAYEFNLKEQRNNSVQYNNFKYTGGRLGDLTTINDDSGQHQSPIYVDYISVFNAYKKYVTDSYGRFIYYPQKNSNGDFQVKVGDTYYTYVGDQDIINRLYEVTEKNGLSGLPIYDKMIITKTTLQRGDQTSQGQIVYRKYNELTENHGGLQGVLIQQVDYLDPQVFIFNEGDRTVSIDQKYYGYINDLLNQKTTVYGQDTSDNTLYTLGTLRMVGNYPYQSPVGSEHDKYIVRTSAKNYPNPQLKTYSITQRQGVGDNNQITNNKQNILLFNQAVLAQVEFDVQVLNQDAKVTGSGKNVNTAFYQRAIDITIQAPIYKDAPN